jgi:hypothetical protein
LTWRFFLLPAMLLCAWCAVGCGASSSTPAADRSTTRPAAEHPSSRALGARAEGRRDCAGATPIAIARRYEDAARQAGIGKAFVRFATEPTNSTLRSAGFPRLVAAIYAARFPAKQRAAAAAGCAEQLARSTGG